MIKSAIPHQHVFTGDRGPWLEHLTQDEGLSLDAAIQLLAPFECIPYVDQERGHMATLIKRNKEVHFAAYRRYRRKALATADRIAEFLQPILDKEVFLVTKLANDENASFIERLGFQRLGSTLDGTTTYILNKISYPGAKTCKRSAH